MTCRHDSARPFICQHTIVQNPYNVKSSRHHLVHHWPQPGLVPRDPGRGTAIENLCYYGAVNNLYGPLRSAEFEAGLAGLGVALRVYGRPKPPEPVLWNDYSQADVVIGLRDLTTRDYMIKPATKLVNAWLAGVPALLGPEPAFRYLRKSKLDYIEVRTPEEVLGAVKHLKENPDIYRAMVQNGLERGKEFDVASITRRWCEVLAGPVAAGFRKWKNRSAATKRILDPVMFAPRAIAHKVAKRYYKWYSRHGYRPISGTRT